MGMRELSQALGNTIDSGEAGDGTQPGTTHSYFILGSYGIRLRTTRVKVESKSVGTTGFVLGHPTVGVLGTSALGVGNAGSYSTVETLYDIQSLVDNGKQGVSYFLGKEDSDITTYGYPNYLIVGTDDTAFTKSDSKLLAELGGTNDVTGDATVTKIATFVCVARSTDNAIVDGNTAKEVGLASAGRTYCVVDTDVGVDRVDVTLNTDA